MYIDLYCERTGPEFWNEPLNAFSNLAFVIAAIYAWIQLSKRSHSDVWEKIVVLLAGMVGIGSFLFHTFASSWAELADVVPIWSFVACYTLLTIYRSTNQNIKRTARIAIITVAVILVITVFTSSDIKSTPGNAPALFNGSIQYAPALAALVIFSIMAHRRKHATRQGLSIATLIFFLALIFRSIDLATCTHTGGMGTHFLWHLFNGIMVGILLHTLINKMPPLISNTAAS